MVHTRESEREGGGVVLWQCFCEYPFFEGVGCSSFLPSPDTGVSHSGSEGLENRTERSEGRHDSGALNSLGSIPD